MAVTLTPYAVADVAALQALTGLPSSGSGLYYARFVNGIGWYNFDPDATTGGVAPTVGTGRWFPLSKETLRANRTYYVRTDGSDSNNGLANTSGGAFLTIPKAIDVATQLDTNTYKVTIQLGDGTYSQGTSFLTLKGFTGEGQIVIQGNSGNASLVVITGTNADGVIQTVATAKNYDFQYVTFTNTGNGHCLNIQNNSYVTVGNCRYGSVGTGWHNVVANGAQFSNANRANSIVGGSSGFVTLFGAGRFEFVNGTLTLTGTPNFSSSFCNCTGLSYVNTNGMVVSGSATGKRYNVLTNAVIGSAGVTFPGSIAGTTDGFGVYT